jgi:membrane protease YdiL (CAAX protease family)
VSERQRANRGPGSARDPRRRTAGALALAVCLLAAANVAVRAGPRHTALVLGPVTAAALVVLARRAGLSYEELGLGRRHLRRGAAYAAVAVAVVAAGYAVATALPLTRPAFLDARYQLSPATAIVTAFATIPLATVLPEEVAFRGVLWGLLARGWGRVVATAASSVLFGLWHVLPSLRLNRVNPAVAAVAGAGPAGVVVAVAGAVTFTALAGVVLCELRRRGGSLLAPIGLHWAVNGLGVLTTTLVARGA